MLADACLFDAVPWQESMTTGLFSQIPNGRFIIVKLSMFFNTFLLLNCMFRPLISTAVPGRNCALACHRHIVPNQIPSFIRVPTYILSLSKSRISGVDLLRLRSKEPGQLNFEIRWSNKSCGLAARCLVLGTLRWSVTVPGTASVT